jgi:hypothetical protein
MSRVSSSFFSALLFFNLIVGFSPKPALAARARVNCDVNACIDRCFRKAHGGGYGQSHWTQGSGCAPKCMQIMKARKKDGLCK